MTLPSQKAIRYFMSYDPDTGIVKRRRGRRGPIDGLTCSIEGKQYNTLKLIWKHQTGQEPPQLMTRDGNDRNRKWNNIIPLPRQLAANPLPSVGVLQNMFYYDHETGDLYLDEQLIKSVNGDGYLVTSINNKRYLVHRIIWKMEFGDEPTKIYHLDGNTKNNRLENLSEHDPKQ